MIPRDKYVIDEIIDEAIDVSWCDGCGNPVDICQCIPENPDFDLVDDEDITEA